MEVIVDTREQAGKQLDMRLEGLKCPFERKALKYGDYSASYIDIKTGEKVSLENKVIIERKYALSEICQNFTTNRDRFTREFERAKNDGCRVHILIEQDSYEKVYQGAYNSKLKPEALSASLHTFGARYNAHINFCRPQTSGRLIRDILYYELREILLSAGGSENEQ